MSRARKSLRRSADFAAALDAALRRALADCLGLDETAVANASQHAVREAVLQFRGQGLYVPVDYSPGVPQQYLDIWESFNGRNHDELATRFGVSVQHVYRVVKVMGEIERDRRQGRLFEPYDPDAVAS
jgi:Mor family transcriptional regulator